MGKEYIPYQIIPKGEKNSLVGRDFQRVCFASVKKLKKMIAKFMVNKGYTIKRGKDYIYCYCKHSKMQNIMLTAHIDTVQGPKGAGVIYTQEEKKKHYMWSPYGIGGDDRCGVYAIFKIISKGYCPTILFCDKEENGGVGSDEFAKDYKDKLNLNCILELDRKGNNDLVFYEEDNKEWQDFLIKLTGWEKADGSFSDICNLYDLKCASVNLSMGYYKQHTKNEYVVWEELLNSIDIVELIINNITQRWEHKEKIRNYLNYPYSYFEYDNWFGEKERQKGFFEYEVNFINEKKEQDFEIVQAQSIELCKQQLEYYYGIEEKNILSIYNIDTCECEMKGENYEYQ